jgi:hypothetical protein
MRLWTLHPKYLDARGLVALWREGLLAQAVLRGQTKGYTHHPQLVRFRQRPSPVGAIAGYLRDVHAEAAARGYCFDPGKIVRARRDGPIAVPRGQLDYEWQHLLAKVKARDPAWAVRLEPVRRPRPHPLFRIVAGGVADWEKGTPAVVLSELVRDEVRDRFSPADAKVVRAELKRASIPMLPGPGRWRDRILLGILKVADGDVREFRRALRIAQSDWRDLLCAAGLHTENWPAVLKRAGYRVP